MRDGTYNNLPNEDLLGTTPSREDVYQRLVDFENRINRAKIMKETWVETSKEVIQHHNPNGLNGSNYFIYKNIRVSEEGTMDSILSDEKDKNTAHVPGHPGAVFEGRV